jgi:hypothetical protein
MSSYDLSHEEHLKLSKIAGACIALKDRLENHFFKVIKFRVVVSADFVDGTTIAQIYGIETEVIVDGTLPAGTIEAAALVR